ncbi:hypothetical protein Tco_1520047, partial [Tanacetum coccineum]
NDIRLAGSAVCFCVESAEPAARSVGHGIGGAGKDIVGSLKTVSRMKSGLFDVLSVSKWNWNV